MKFDTVEVYEKTGFSLVLGKYLDQ
jgi:hypothetical protein